MEDNLKIVRVDVSGLDESRWQKFRHQLLNKLMDFMETELDPIKHTSIKEEVAQFTHKLLEFGKAKLSKPAIDNDKTIAEIEELYSRRLLNIAEARKTNAEAEAIEIKNTIGKFKMMLTMTKVIVSGKKDEETVTFLKDIDQFLIAIKAFEQNDTGIIE